MTGMELLKKNRSDIFRIASHYGASNLRVFGSVARGEDNSGSDIDLLVSMERGRSYFDLVGFWQELEDKLHCKVDVVTDGGISPYLREHILSEAKPL